MPQDRAAFVEYLGGDELVPPPAEAQEHVNAYRQQRQEAMLARRPGRFRDRDALHNTHLSRASPVSRRLDVTSSRFWPARCHIEPVPGLRFEGRPPAHTAKAAGPT